MVSVLKRKPNKPKITLYGILGMPPGATAEALHDRYLEIAYSLRHVVSDPDGGSGPDAERFRALTAAWGTLRDAKSRERYDLQLKLAGGQCEACEGRGQKWTFKTKKEAPCVACEGTGQKP